MDIWYFSTALRHSLRFAYSTVGFDQVDEILYLNILIIITAIFFIIITSLYHHDIDHHKP